MTDPLFLEDLPTLRSELRLSGVPDNADANAIIQRALLDARVQFNARLGISVVAELVAITFVANPTTASQIRRALARLLEVQMVRLALLDVLPAVFMDGSGGDTEFLNQEGAFRSIDPDRLERQRRETRSAIETGFTVLEQGQELGDVGTGQMATQADQDLRIYPFGSILGNNVRLFGDPTRQL